MKRILTAILCLCLCFGTVRAASEAPAVQAERALAEKCGVSAGQLLADRNTLPAGSSGSDWLAMAFALGGVPERYQTYRQALEDYVTDCYAKEGSLSTTKATEYHRIALTVLALGGAPTAFGKKPDGSSVNLIAEGTYAFAGTLGAQGLNGWIFALIALDAGNDPVPEGAAVTRDTIRAAILAAQEPDGGFGLTTGASDVDITAMALQALAPYEADCADAVGRALTYLSGQQTEDGGFVSYGDENPESCAQVLIALTALGIDPDRDDRFVKNGKTAENAMDRYLRPDGTYRHSLTETKANMIATAQALLAKAALAKSRSGGGRLYDMTGVTAPAESKAGVSPLWVLIPVGIVGAAAGAAVGVRRKRNGKTD